MDNYDTQTDFSCLRMMVLKQTSPILRIMLFKLACSRLRTILIHTRTGLGWSPSKMRSKSVRILWVNTVLFNCRLCFDNTRMMELFRARPCLSLYVFLMLRIIAVDETVADALIQGMFCYFVIYFVGAQRNCLSEAIPMSSNKICFMQNQCDCLVNLNTSLLWNHVLRLSRAFRFWW